MQTATIHTDRGRAHPAVGSALAWVMAAAWWALGPIPTVRAQVPQPLVTDIEQRSGLLSRFAPAPTRLPPDPDRDTFYGTRYELPDPNRPNAHSHGGLYGQRLKAQCTACVSPSFRGAPGKSTLNEGCRPGHPAFRLITNTLHPFRPVDSYYDGGCYVPIYDLDPLVTGPGPYPWPFFRRQPAGG